MKVDGDQLRRKKKLLVLPWKGFFTAAEVLLGCITTNKTKECQFCCWAAADEAFASKTNYTPNSDRLLNPDFLIEPFSLSFQDGIHLYSAPLFYQRIKQLLSSHRTKKLKTFHKLRSLIILLQMIYLCF